MKIIICAGPSLTGKSTWATEFARQHPNFIILCADDLREYYCGGVSDQSKNYLIFPILKAFAEILLAQGKDILLANTTINKKNRKMWIELAQKRMCIIEAVVFTAPIEVCIERGKLREKNKIPIEVLERQFKAFEQPSFEEGFYIINQVDEFGVIHPVFSAINTQIC